MKVILAVTNDLVGDQRVHKVALTLQKNDYNVTLLGRRLKESLPVENRTYTVCRLKLLFNKGPLFYAAINFRFFFFILFRRFDIIVANDLDTLLGSYLVVRLKQIFCRNKPQIIYDSHEYFTEVPELIERNVTRKFWLKIEKAILPRIKYCYTVCESIAETYNHKYGIEMKVVRNVPFMNHQIDETIVIDPKIKSQINGRKIIIYQGAINIGRGIENMIKAMQFIDNAVFLIIGSGDILGNLRNLVIQMNLQQRVIFTGKLAFNELLTYTQIADIGISLEENLGLNYFYALPNKLFDYIKAGVPVIASPLPEIERVVKKYDIGVVVDNNKPEYLADTIEKMLADVLSIKKWKKNSLDAAIELNWENESKILLRVYNSAQ